MAGRGRSVVDVTAVAGVVLDLDGTLVDSNYLHVTAWWEAFCESGVPVTAADVHHLLGRPSGDLVGELAPQVSSEVRNDIVAAHSRNYAPYRERLAATPGAGDLLRSLHDAGLRLVVATSAKPDDVEALLAATGAPDTVYRTVDSAEADSGKPAADPVVLACQRGSLDPDRTVMLGDSVWDVTSARRAGIRCVAVTCGGISAEELRGAGADGVYRSPAELLDRLRDSPIAAILNR